MPTPTASPGTAQLPAQTRPCTTVNMMGLSGTGTITERVLDSSPTKVLRLSMTTCKQ